MPIDKEYYVTIMSIDPDDSSEDNHQKYGLTVFASSEQEAIKKGKEEFNQEHGSLPIYWAKASL